jgi:hypothetical protein
MKKKTPGSAGILATARTQKNPKNAINSRDDCNSRNANNTRTPQ